MHPAHAHIKASQTQCGLLSLSPRAGLGHSLVFSIFLLSSYAATLGRGSPSKRNAKLTSSVKPSLTFQLDSLGFHVLSLLQALHLLFSMPPIRAPPIAQPSFAWLVLIPPPLRPGWPPPGSTSCAQWSSDCGRRQTRTGLPAPSVTCYGTLGYVRSRSRPQLPCLKIRNKDSSPPQEVVRVK